MGKLKVFAAANIDDQAKTIWRGVADSLASAIKKASHKTGLPASEILAWEDGTDE